jgi:HAD superfamily hydrolase (TIGR01549 family)
VKPIDYRAWLVDLDGTLYTAHWVKLAMAAELLVSGWRAIPTLRAFRLEHELLRVESVPVPVPDLEHDPTSGRTPFERQLERTALRLDLGVAVVEERVSTWMIARPRKWISLFRRRTLLEELATFRRSGGRLALVSDYPARDKLAALGVSDLFDVVVASGEPGGPRRLKPAPDGYLTAARRLGVTPTECLVIGDRDDADGAAARSAGMGFRRVR